MEYIAIFMFGAMFGIVCTIIPKCFSGTGHKVEEQPPAEQTDEKQKRLQEQWEAFLNYSGDDVGGGLVDD